MTDRLKEPRKQALMETAIYLLIIADDGHETVKIKQAIKRLQAVVKAREAIGETVKNRG